MLVVVLPTLSEMWYALRTIHPAPAKKKSATTTTTMIPTTVAIRSHGISGDLRRCPHVYAFAYVPVSHFFNIAFWGNTGAE